MKKQTILSVCLVAAMFAGCSEATDDVGTGASGGATASTGAANGSTGAKSGASTSGKGSTASGSQSTATGSGMGGLTVNEISAQGDDYIELFNTGSDAVDLSNLRVADEDSPGVPKLTEAVTLPEGTSIAPGAYLFVLAGVSNPGTGPQTECAPGPSPCFQAGFGLSKDGDGVYVLAEDDSIIVSAEYPGALPDGATWSRLPNGSGDFGNGTPTPGAENAAQ